MWFLYALLAAAFLAADNVTESIIVRHYEKNPLIITFCYGIVGIMFFLFVPKFVDVQTPWMWYLLLFGMTAYLGDLFFTYVVDRLDISVVNAAWPILAIILSGIGIIFFGEVWNIPQSIGAVLTVGAVFFLSFWHIHISLMRTVLLLLILGALFVPQAVSIDSALLRGEEIFPVYYWSFVGSLSLNVLTPWLFASSRKKLLKETRRVLLAVFPRCAIVALLFMAGMFFICLAYAHGPLSLVAIISNTQPFFVIFYAWMLSSLFPLHAPRELLTAQSVQVKLVSFAIVFVGLGLLAVG
jgi:drug/metabolite transporter (DMT)-like permease